MPVVPVAVAALFVFVESRASEPIIPLELFRISVADLDGRLGLTEVGHALSDVTAAVLYVQMLVDPVDRIVSILDELQLGAASLSRLLGVAQVLPRRGRERLPHVHRHRLDLLELLVGRVAFKKIELSSEERERALLAFQTHRHSRV